jgi:serine protease
MGRTTSPGPSPARSPPGACGRTGYPTRHPLLADPIIKGEVIVRFEEANLSPEAALARVRVSGYRAVHKGYISEHLHAFRFERSDLQAMSGTTGPSTVQPLTSAEHTALVQSLASAPGVRIRREQPAPGPPRGPQ